MKAFICVYQHPNPSRRDWDLTRAAVAHDPLLDRFLSRYYEANCVYDWGDDPSFFAAQHRLGDARAASWGVCRPDVRRQLRDGDFVVWFCARADRGSAQRLTYHFVGCSTVLEPISRRTLWVDPRYSRYRSFYNVLARVRGGALEQLETFHEYHGDWEKRARIPYILFDPDRARSEINVDNALVVAHRDPGMKQEIWRSEVDPKVAELEQLLLARSGRRLRTTNPRVPHRHIALHVGRTVHQLEELRRRLIDFERTRRVAT